MLTICLVQLTDSSVQTDHKQTRVCSIVSVNTFRRRKLMMVLTQLRGRIFPFDAFDRHAQFVQHLKQDNALTYTNTAGPKLQHLYLLFSITNMTCSNEPEHVRNPHLF